MNKNNEVIITGYIGDDGEFVINPEDNKILYWIEENGLESLRYLSSKEIDELRKQTEKKENGNQTWDVAGPSTQTYNDDNDDDYAHENESPLINIDHDDEHADQIAGPSTGVGSKIQQSCQSSGDWNHQKTLALIEAYPEIANSSKDNLSPEFWKKISGFLVTKGTAKTWGECKAKWKFLLRTYRNNFKKMSTSGESPPSWVYFKMMHNILGKKPENQPVSIGSSIAGYKKKIVTEIGDDESKTKKRKIKDTQPEWLKEVRKEAATRHAESMEVKRQFAASFADYITFLKNKDSNNES